MTSRGGFVLTHENFDNFWAKAPRRGTDSCVFSARHFDIEPPQQQLSKKGTLCRSQLHSAAATQHDGHDKLRPSNGGISGQALLFISLRQQGLAGGGALRRFGFRRLRVFEPEGG